MLSLGYSVVFIAIQSLGQGKEPLQNLLIQPPLLGCVTLQTDKPKIILGFCQQPATPIPGKFTG